MYHSCKLDDISYYKIMSNSPQNEN